MKAPELKNLGSSKPEDEFSKAIVKQSEKSSVFVRKTFSIQQGELDYINAEALKQSQAVGKVISASQALRTIIQRDKGSK